MYLEDICQCAILVFQLLYRYAHWCSLIICLCLYACRCNC